MSGHHAHIRWQRQSSDFTYDTYNRAHTVTFGGGVQLEASGAAEYRGDARLPNPEEMLVAALSNCHMLSFLAIAARMRIVVELYEDEAVGTMTANASGKLFVSRVELRPQIVFAAPIAPALLAELHHRAHAECFIANSVITEVVVVELAGAPHA